MQLTRSHPTPIFAQLHTLGPVPFFPAPPRDLTQTRHMASFCFAHNFQIVLPLTLLSLLLDATGQRGRGGEGRVGGAI